MVKLHVTSTVILWKSKLEIRPQIKLEIGVKIGPQSEKLWLFKSNISSNLAAILQAKMCGFIVLCFIAKDPQLDPGNRYKNPFVVEEQASNK